ncbi:MAG: FAD:protein FMN transferase [Clostridiales bacterium]|jgi:thiamine biosynthesis lipoprotein|nr:FAD:protein FMN transferase [Clostridiales bacterium]
MLPAIFSAGLIASGCGNPGLSAGSSLNSQSRAGILGTVLTISSYGDTPQSVYDECFSAAQDVENLMSLNRPDSELSRLNQSGELSVSGQTYALVQKALEYSRLSEGAFDVTVGAVMQRWRIGADFIRLPPREEIQGALLLVGSEKIKMEQNNRIALEKGMLIDLGGIAKGYACDIAAQALRERGVQRAILDYGGNIYALGEKADGEKWRVGIRNPVLGADGYICVYEASDQAVVTSGGYERNFEQGGVTYHHILDPKTGYPAQSSLLSATIISKLSADADALSTACFVMGLERGAELLESLDGFEGIFVTDAKEIFFTSGLGGALELIDSSFSIFEVSQ